MEDPNSSIFSYAKMEYTNQLIDTLSPHIFDGVKSVYEEAKTANLKNQSKSILIFFRLFLEKVPSWSNEIIENETQRIIEVSCCDWLDDLIMAVFISHTKILTSIGSNQNANIDLTIPKTVNFIHKCYINVAREIWKNPYLYNENINGTDYQRNMHTIETIIKDGIENTIRRLLPIKEILKKHLDTYENNNLEQQKKRLTTDFKELLLNELKELNLLNTQNKSKKKKKIKNIENESDNEDSDSDNDDENNDEENNNDENNDDENNDDENNDDENNDDNFVEGNTDVKGDNVDDDTDNNNITIDIREDPEIINNTQQLDYDSPDEETIQKNCENIEINDIPDVTKEYSVENIQEEKYDNVDISTNIEKKDNRSDLLNSFIQNLPEKPVLLQNNKEEEKKENSIFSITKEKDPEPVKKENLINKPNNLLNKPEPNNDPLINPNLNIKENKVEEKVEEVKEKIEEKVEESKEVNNKPKFSLLEEIPEDNEVKIVKQDNNLKKNELKEVISVSKIDNTDTETVDDFFNDVTKLLEEKGENINKDVKSYTLFDDAGEKE